MKKRIAVFAHYDKDNIIDDYVIYYLKELKKVAEIVFVSDCDLPENELKKIDKLVIKSIAERHGEYDFGSYKKGFLFIEKKLRNYDELIFANDSCYGPFFPFKDLWKEMDKKKSDFWGVFKHFDPTIHKWHLQSYFLVFKKQVFTSKTFDSFVKKIKKLKTKRDMILKNEVGFSTALYKAGFKDATICLKNTENETYTNKAFEFILEKKIPILKKTLLASNPFYECKLNENFKLFSRTVKTKYSQKLITDNLKRTAPEHKNNWFYDIRNKKKSITVFNRELLRFKFKNQKYFFFFTMKVFGISLLKIPFWVNYELWKYKRKKNEKTF